MESITFHLKSKEFIEELLKTNPDLQIAIKDGIIDKSVKRALSKEYLMIRFKDDVRNILKEEIDDRGGNGQLKKEIRDRIKKGVEESIDELLKTTLTSIYEDRILNILDEIVEKHTEKLKSMDFEKMVKEEIESQVKVRLDRLWKNP